MRKLFNKSQAALEFLMTYAWAILAVLLAIGALNYFGILDPSIFFTEVCLLEVGLACTDFVIGEDAVKIVLRNSLGQTITISDIDLADCAGDPDVPSILKSGQTGTYTIGLCNFEKKRYIADFIVTYIGESELEKKVKGSIRGISGSVDLNYYPHKFIAMYATTIEYGTVFDNTEILKNDILEIVISTPGVGTFSVVQGDIISSNKPIGLIDNNRGLIIPSLTLSGNEHVFRSSRNQPHTVYIYAVSQDVTTEYYLDIFDVDGPPTQTVNVLAGQIEELSLGVEGTHRFYSDGPIILAKRASADNIFVPPASTEIVHSMSESRRMMFTGGTITSFDNLRFTSASLLSSTQIADGAGGDSELGMPVSFLGDSYVITHPISDFAIVSIASNTVEVYHYTGGSFVLWNSYDHGLATNVNPIETEVGPQAGNGPDLGLTPPIWIRGTAPFYLRTNDPSNDDEYSPFGFIE